MASRFFSGSRQTLEGRQEFVAGVHDFHLNSDPLENPDDSLGFALPHQSVFNEVGLESAAQSPVTEQGDDGGIDSAGQSGDGRAVADGVRYFLGLDAYEFLGVHFRGGNLFDLHAFAPKSGQYTTGRTGATRARRGMLPVSAREKRREETRTWRDCLLSAPTPGRYKGDFLEDLFLGTFYQQHLGEAYSGLSTFADGQFRIRTHRGLFRATFVEDLGGLAGTEAIGYCGSVREPHFSESRLGRLSACFSGNITNLKELVERFQGPRPHSDEGRRYRDHHHAAGPGQGRRRRDPEDGQGNRRGATPC